MGHKLILGVGSGCLLVACFVVLSSGHYFPMDGQSKRQSIERSSREFSDGKREVARRSPNTRIGKKAIPSSDPAVEKSRDLFRRVATLRVDLENSKDPYGFVSAFLNDVARLQDPMQRDFYALSLVNQLVNFDAEENKKYEWLARLYPQVEDALEVDANLSRPLKSTLFGVLYSRGHSMGVDPYEETLKISSNEVREKFIDNLLPHMVTLNDHAYPEIMNTLPPERKLNVEQAIIEEAIRNKASRLYALGLYLEGGGAKGVHEQEISKLMNDTGWYWKNADKIGNSIEHAPPGPRRDTAIANMIRVIQSRDTEAARKWLPEIGNSEIREHAAEKISDKDE